MTRGQLADATARLTAAGLAPKHYDRTYVLVLVDASGRRQELKSFAEVRALTATAKRKGVG